MKKIILLTAIFLLGFASLLFPDSIRATGRIDFGECPDAGGDVVANWPMSWHWIQTNPVLQFGDDIVYHLGSDNYRQCFCPQPYPDFTPSYTDGIQTNWLKVSNLDPKFHQSLLNAGWVIQNGADFGLAPEPYFAKNFNFHCEDSAARTR